MKKNLIVQKYGGTSIASPEEIKNVASRIIETKNKGNNVVVVVSASGDTTDDLLTLAKKITPTPDERELDMLLATGEQQAVALVAMAIKSKGVDAISFTGLQIGIITDSVYTKARIQKIKNIIKIHNALKQGKIVIVAGFQGVSLEDDITTLGRGGSDLTAVALAHALKAKICELYKDVNGIFTADPKIVPEARLLPKISYDEMLEMASLGAIVVNARSIEYAKKYNVPISVRSSFNFNNEGTLIGEEKDMEKLVVSGVTYNKDEAKITVLWVPDKPGISAKIFRSIADENINVDMIIQDISEGGITNISFTVVKSDLKKALKVVESKAKEINATGVVADEKIAKVSIVGVGMLNHPGVAAMMFEALAEKGINIQMISTSEIKISCVIDEAHVEKAVSAIHKKFNLEKAK